MRRADPDTAHDVHSETWLVAWRRVDELPAEPLPWLLGVARRVLANARRTEDRRSALEDRMAFDPSSPMAVAGAGASVGAAGESESDGLVLQALSGLSEADREALLLVAWDGLRPAEAAGVLELRPAAFTMRFSRARRRLASAVEALEAELAANGEGVPHGA